MSRSLCFEHLQQGSRKAVRRAFYAVDRARSVNLVHPFARDLYSAMVGQVRDYKLRDGAGRVRAFGSHSLRPGSGTGRRDEDMPFKGRSGLGRAACPREQVLSGVGPGGPGSCLLCFASATSAPSPLFRFLRHMSEIDRLDQRQKAVARLGIMGRAIPHQTPDRGCAAFREWTRLAGMRRMGILLAST